MKRIISLLLVCIMVGGLLPRFTLTSEAADVTTAKSVTHSSIAIGDYITLGTYLGEPIVWRCVGIDENGPLMLSDKILCLKAFDAAGADSSYHTDGWGYIRKARGSNCWSDSSIRQWLNSSDAVVNYTHCPPNSANVSGGYNPYDKEAGFLSGFTASELSLIKSVTNVVNINRWETKRDGYCDGGSSLLLSYYTPSATYVDYSKYYHQNVTDKMFLLTATHADTVYQFDADYYTYAYPTEAAVANSTYQADNLSPEKPWCYSLANPAQNNSNCFELVTIANYFEGPNYALQAYSGWIGIRPAFYLNTGNVEDVTNAVINSHIDFYQNNYKKVVDNLSFSKVKPFVAKTSTLVAYQIWDTTGDIGTLASLSINGISMNYYDVFMSEFFLKMTSTEDELLKKTCLEKEAKIFLSTGKAIATDIAAVVSQDNELQRDLSDLNKDWKEILHWDDASVFNDNLRNVFSEQDDTMDPVEKVLYDKIFSKYLSDIGTKTMFSGYEKITTLASTLMDGIDAVRKIHNARVIAESAAEINDDFFVVFVNVLNPIIWEGDLSSQEYWSAVELRDVLGKYREIATDEDAMFEYIFEETLKSTATFYWENSQLKDALKELTYVNIAKKLGCEPLWVKAAVATYNGTYKLLDSVLKLNDKKKLYCLMSCISPIEGRLADTVDSFGRKLAETPTLENAQKFDCAFRCLKEMNAYLYACLHNYAAYFDSAWKGEVTRNAAVKLMSIAASKQTAWSNESCHSESIAANYKQAAVRCPVDVYVYDKDGSCAASVVDETTTITDPSVNVLVSNEMKSIVFPSSTDYRIEVIAREEGEMEFGVAEVDPYRYDETNVKSYTGIQLEELKEIIADVGASTQVQETRLLVLDDEKVPEKEILVCGQEVAYYDELPSVTGKVSSYSPQIPVMITLYAQGDRTTALYSCMSELAVGDGRVIQEFKVSNVIPGTYDAVITKQGYLPYETEIILTDEADVELPDIQLLLEESTTTVEKTSMVLGNDLSIMFAFTANDITGTDSYAVVTKTYADGTADRVERIEQSAWGDPIIIGGKNYYAISFDGVAAKEMTDEVQVQIFNAAGEPISEVHTDSIRDYAIRMIKNGTSVQMFVDMLVYGAEAQKQFESYGIGVLATSQLTAQQLAQATRSVSYENKLVADDGYRASSLILESNIQLALLFGGIDQTMTAEVSFTDHYGETKRYTIAGSEFEPVTYKGEACYSITVDELVMADARQLVTITVKDTDGNVMASATDSVESYIARMSNTGTLYESIMKFSDSAAAGLKN